jgi:hypothetical protein
MRLRLPNDGAVRRQQKVAQQPDLAVALAQQFPGSTRRLEESPIRDRPDPELPDRLQVVVKGVAAEVGPRLA